MLKTILVLPDGTEISSGPGTVNAVRWVTITQCVSDSQEADPGAACANMLEAELITPAGGLPIEAGQELAVYREDDTGQRHKVGVFVTSKPARPSANTLKLLAYDRVSLLDKDLTGWLSGLTGWPYPLQDFAAMVCKACGVTLAAAPIPNGDFPVEKFSASDITGRRLIRWVGQACGRFCRANEEGVLEFAWYAPREGVTVGPRFLPGDTPVLAAEAGDLSIEARNVQATCARQVLTLMSPGLRAALQGDNLYLSALPYATQYFYYQGGLTVQDTPVAPIERVHLRQTREDVGTLFPDTPTGNTLTITANPLLAAKNGDYLLPIAQRLYEQMHAVSYTPCKVRIAANMHIRAGDILTLITPGGKLHTLYVMKKTQSGQQETLECTGSVSREAGRAVQNSSLQAVASKVLELSMSVDGLQLENRDAEGKTAALALTVDGISAQVSHQQLQMDQTRTRLTKIEQDAESVAVQIQSLYTDGVRQVTTSTGYTFGAEGLRIRKSGQEMENLLDNTGMYVTRAGQTILQANSAGVTASDVTVRNYLLIGGHARLEDYNTGTDPNRTGCFYI